MAQALFLVLAIIVTLTMRPSREISNLQAQEPKFLNEALQAYQSGGEEGLENISELSAIISTSGFSSSTNRAANC